MAREEDACLIIIILYCALSVLCPLSGSELPDIECMRLLKENMGIQLVPEGRGIPQGFRILVSDLRQVVGCARLNERRDSCVAAIRFSLLRKTLEKLRGASFSSKIKYPRTIISAVIKHLGISFGDLESTLTLDPCKRIARRRAQVLVFELNISDIEKIQRYFEACKVLRMLFQSLSKRKGTT